MKFKVGDKIKVVLVDDKESGIKSYEKDLRKFIGKIGTIKGIILDGFNTERDLIEVHFPCTRKLRQYYFREITKAKRKIG